VSLVTNLIVVALEGYKDLHIFGINNNKLEKTGTLSVFDYPILSACFDSNDHLWVSSAPVSSLDPVSPLLSVLVYDGSNCYQQLPQYDSFSSVVQSINDNCSFCVETTIYDSFASSLSRNLQFKKKRGEAIEGDDGVDTDAYTQRGKSKTKKSKSQQTPKTTPSFV